MEPNFDISNDPILSKEKTGLNKQLPSNEESQENRHQNLGVGESNEHLINNDDNYFIGDDSEKKKIDDGIKILIEYIMQEKICPNIMPYQEKLMAYLTEKIEDQVENRKLVLFIFKIGNGYATLGRK